MIKQSLRTPSQSRNASYSERLPLPAPMLIGAAIYLFCLLFSVAPIFNLASIPTRLWISIKLVWAGKWLPTDLHLLKDTIPSRQSTIFLEILSLLFAAFLCYGFCSVFIHKHNIKGREKQLMLLIWFVSIIGGSIYLFTPGVISSDLYSYAIYGRLLGIHFTNPYFTPPSTFPHDPLYSYLYWKSATTIYGPIWTLLSALLSRFIGTNPFTITLAFRLLALAAHLLNTLLITAILRTLGRSERTILLGTLLYAWNPLALLESSLGGHNDLLMLTFILLGFLLSARAEQHALSGPRAYLPSLLAFTLAVLVKLSALPILAIFLLALFIHTLRPISSPTTNYTSEALLSTKPLPPFHSSQHPPLQWRTALLSTLLASIASAVLALLLYGPFWLGHDLNAIIKSFATTPAELGDFASLYFFLEIINSAHPLPIVFTLLLHRPAWNTASSLAMLLPILPGTILLWRAPTIRNIALIALTSLAAFLWITPWFFAWYAIWLLPLAILLLPINHDRSARALLVLTLTFSATALLTYYSNLALWLLLTYKSSVTIWPLLLALSVFILPLLISLVTLLFPQKSNGTDNPAPFQSTKPA